MKKVAYTTFIAFGLLISSLSFIGSAQAASQDTVKLYTLFGGASLPVMDPVLVDLAIGGQSLTVKNHGADFPGGSYVEVSSSLLNKQITAASFVWNTQNKTFTCASDNLPLVVKAGDFNNGTRLHFTCK